MKRRAVFLILIVTLMTVVAGAAQTPSPPVTILTGVGIDQRLAAQIPMNLIFHDETGQSVHLADLQSGKPIILVLVQFNCPSLCTVELNAMLNTLKVIPQNVGDQVDVWTVSFDPAETPALAAQKKEQYVNSYRRTRPAATNASAGWHFLTGDAGNIEQLTRAVGFHYRWDEPSKQFIHPAGLMILTPQGVIARYYFGVDFEPTDLRLSLVEASGGKIGTITDQVLLFCYRYDPSTGKYNLAIGNALRVGAVLMTLLLAGLLAMLWRADRRRTRALAAAIASERKVLHE